MSTPAAAVVGDIILGNYDSELDILSQAIATRKASAVKQMVGALRPGDEVRFSSFIRPRYLEGKTATIVKINRQSVVVNCPADPTYGRFNGSKNVRCPNSLIEGLV